MGLVPYLEVRNGHKVSFVTEEFRLRSDGDTSHQSSASQTKSKLDSKEWRILDKIHEAGLFGFGSAVETKMDVKDCVSLGVHRVWSCFCSFGQCKKDTHGNESKWGCGFLWLPPRRP